MIFDVAPNPIMYTIPFLAIFGIVAIIVLIVVAVIILVKANKKK